MKPQTYIAILLALLVCPAATAVDSASYKEGRAYVTEGSLDNVLWYESGKSVLTDYSGYDNWALKGLDGKDPVSAKYWEQFVCFNYQNPEILTLTYNINLPWPFGSKNNKLRMKVDESRLDDGILKMTLMDRQFGVDECVFYICAENSSKHPGTRIIRFKLALTFGWFIEKILDVNGYNGHMQSVMSMLAGNLEEYSKVRAALLRQRGEDAPDAKGM